jgi:flagellar protein FliT
MNSSVQVLEDAGRSLRAALSNQDWESIAVIDQQCREAVEEVAVTLPRNEPLLKEKMQALLEIYKELIDACRSERKRLADEILQVRKSCEGAKVYQLQGYRR